MRMEPTLPRNQSVGCFLDLRDVYISDELADNASNGRQSSSDCGEGEGEAPTPRGAPCISLPKQNRQSLTHFAIGAAARGS